MNVEHETFFIHFIVFGFAIYYCGRKIGDLFKDDLGEMDFGLDWGEIYHF